MGVLELIEELGEGDHACLTGYVSIIEVLGGVFVVSWRVLEGLYNPDRRERDRPYAVAYNSKGIPFRWGRCEYGFDKGQDIFNADDRAFISHFMHKKLKSAYKVSRPYESVTDKSDKLAETVKALGDLKPVKEEGEKVNGLREVVRDNPIIFLVAATVVGFVNGQLLYHLFWG